MTQTISSRKRSRDLEDSDLLPSPKRIDFNFNSAIQTNNHFNGNDEADGPVRYLQNGACYHGQPLNQGQPELHPSSDHQPMPSLSPQHMNSHGLPPHNPQNGGARTYLDSSTCTAFSNLHLMSRDQAEIPSCSSDMPSCGSSFYTEINRVLRDAHFARLSRLNGAYREEL